MNQIVVHGFYSKIIRHRSVFAVWNQKWMNLQIQKINSIHHFFKMTCILGISNPFTRSATFLGSYRIPQASFSLIVWINQSRKRINLSWFCILVIRSCDCCTLNDFLETLVHSIWPWTWNYLSCQQGNVLYYTDTTKLRDLINKSYKD